MYGIYLICLSGARRTYRETAYTEEYYTIGYTPEDTLRGHLRFALKYEPCDLAILVAALTALGSEELGARKADWGI